MPPIFDGHNDALTRQDAADLVTGRAGGHLDLPRARAGGLTGGVFAVFTPSPGTTDVVLRPGGGYDLTPAEPVGHEQAAAHATAAAGRLLALEREGHLRVARTSDDLDASARDGRPAAVLGLEGAEAIDPGLEALELWHAAGLRVLGPVWSRPNAFATGVPFAHPGSPMGSPPTPGLTPAGRRLVDACAELGIAVDLAHLNERGFWDVAERSARPLVCSHTACHALAPSSRNLTDRQLDAIGASGGVVGIVFGSTFLRADGADNPDTPLTAIVDHVRHAAERIGVDHVGLGSDFDGVTIPAALGDVTGLPRLLDALRDHGGFTRAEVHAIAWANWRRVLEASWSA